MLCERTETHTVQPGDSLYRIARMHRMTVSQLVDLNPGVDPFNMQIGSQIIVCQGQEHDNGDAMELNNEMRLVWEQHVYWMRMYMISLLSGLQDFSAVQDRLMRNPQDMAQIFARYYSPETADMIRRLLMEHLQIGGELMSTWSKGQMVRANELNRQWYVNANQIADALSAINPFFNQEALRQMLWRHLELTKEQIANRMAKNYAMDIQAFDQVEQEILQLADYLTKGILSQFPS